MKEIGVGWALRLTAKGIKPRIIISEAGGKWTLRTESAIKTLSYDFIPGAEFDEVTPDGREVKVISHFYDHHSLLLLFSQQLTSKVINGYIHPLTRMEKSQL